jgi:hypothetical protein
MERVEVLRRRTIVRGLAALGAGTGPGGDLDGDGQVVGICPPIDHHQEDHPKHAEHFLPSMM